MNQSQEFNSLQFIVDAGPVAMLVALLLLVMSVASWYLMIVKAWRYYRMTLVFKKYVTTFWATANLQAALKVNASNCQAYELAQHAHVASKHYYTHAAKHAEASCDHDEFVARSMRRDLSNASAELEGGVSILASVGSIAPFVGLFGTVWGIYHALAAISASGQATLDKVAGPVGEALIMTAIGLAVAIPAVLAYNAFVKLNRQYMHQLETFGQDLHVLITTGAVLKTASIATPESQRDLAASIAGHEEVPA